MVADRYFEAHGKKEFILDMLLNESMIKKIFIEVYILLFVIQWVLTGDPARKLHLIAWRAMR